MVLTRYNQSIMLASTTTPRQEFLSGVKAELPLLLGVAPFGMIYGVLAIQAGVGTGLGQLMSCIVFAGASQLVVVQLIGNAAPALMLVVTAFVINLRHLLYSASIAPSIQHLSFPWKSLLAYLLTDEAYAIAITHFNQEPLPSESSGNNRHWFFLGCGLALWTCWQLCTAVGIFLGAQIPSSWSLDFSLALTFIAIVVPSLKDRPALFAAAAAGVTAVIFYPLPYKLGLILAAFVGIIAGLWSEKR